MDKQIPNNPNLLIQRLKESLNDEKVKSSFSLLTDLISVLEEVDDPDPHQLRLYENIVNVIQYFSILNNNLTEITKKNNSLLPGTILSKLYDKNTAIGSSKIFED